MKAAKLTHQAAFSLVAKIPPGARLIPAHLQKWDILVVVKDCDGLNGRFKKSIEQHVDALSKRTNILKALQELYGAVLYEDYQSELAQSGVDCKVAHSFKNGTIKVWELKPNNKDRIYFYPSPEKINGKKAIFLLIAYHKKDQQTPKEVKEACERAITEILGSLGNIEICEEKNVAKK